jgi:hypothetical protein
MGCRLKAIPIILFISALILVAFTCLAANKAYAHASLVGDSTTPPGSWEPLGFNITGTTADFVVKNLGWNATSLGGNVGIGDGSLKALRQISNANNLDFSPDQYFMSADVTTAPWNLARISNFNAAQGNETAANETSAENTTTASNTTVSHENGAYKITGTSVGNITMALPQRDVDVSNNSSAEENTTAPEASGEPQGPRGNIGRPMELNDPYHSILLGRPVNDLMYEDPLTINGTMYFRLVGLRMPDGEEADVGMRSLGYGY